MKKKKHFQWKPLITYNCGKKYLKLHKWNGDHQNMQLLFPKWYLHGPLINETQDHKQYGPSTQLYQLVYTGSESLVKVLKGKEWSNFLYHKSCPLSKEKNFNHIRFPDLLQRLLRKQGPWPKQGRTAKSSCFKIYTVDSILIHYQILWHYIAIEAIQFGGNWEAR